MTSQSIVDLVVLGILLYCAVKGASRGLLSQLSWVIALLLCFKFSGTLAPAIEPFVCVDPLLDPGHSLDVVRDRTGNHRVERARSRKHGLTVFRPQVSFIGRGEEPSDSVVIRGIVPGVTQSDLATREE